jgi:hypothetical protein
MFPKKSINCPCSCHPNPISPFLKTHFTLPPVHSEGWHSVDAYSKAYEDCHAGERKYMKPWTLTLIMFFGEALCLPVYFYKRHQARKAAKNFQDSSLGEIGFAIEFFCLLKFYFFFDNIWGKKGETTRMRIVEEMRN